jgi:hypothetical protein
MAVVLLIAAAGASAQSDTVPVMKLQFKTFVQLGIPEQDAFIDHAGSASDQVWRVDPADIKGAAVLGKMVYATTRFVTHDPLKMGPDALGPFPRGAALGFTLRQWLMAKGVGTYTVRGERAVITASFRGLIPNGVYTLWCVPAPMRPADPLPCGALDGSENTFKADRSGSADVTITTTPLPAGAVIAPAYHSDGKTYGAKPGDFGKNTHVQLVVFLPASL